MPSERVQRHIDRLLDEADAAVARRDWPAVRALAREALALDPESADAAELAAAAGRMLAASDAPPALTEDEKAALASAMEWALTGDEPLPEAVGGTNTVRPEALEELALRDSKGQVEAAEEAHLPERAAPYSSTATTPTSFSNGRYEVRRFLGEGGKKRVYLAHDTLLDRDVAFALIKTEGLDAAARTRITREAQAMGRLGDHPNIVTVYDIGEEASQPYMVLPVLAGGDVEGLIEKAPEHKLPLPQALKIATEVCRGLEFAHTKGIIHRDLKPGNVWLTGGQDAGVAKIGDFGLAVAADRSRLTQAGMMVGTVSYMPPEQAMGGEVTPRSDLYSLGAMLYEMVCGRPPFVGDESVAIIGQHLNTPPVAPTWHRPDCPPVLETLILRLLEKDPSKRPASASEVQGVLGSVRPEALEEPALRDSKGQVEATILANAGAASEASPKLPLPTGEGRGEGPAPTNPLYRSTFVGREQELKQLQSAFDAALGGNGGLVMVVGEPGIGKTALCEQLATYAALRGGRALVGHSYEEGSLSLPYLAFVEAMRSYVLTREPDGLKTDLGTGAADVARIVSEVRDRLQLAAHPEALEGRPPSDPEDDRWRLLQAVTGFLRNASSVQPLLLVLEDLHWADRGTLDLLQHLARNLQGARLLVVGTYRDVEVDRTHPLSATLAELRRSSNLPRVLLRGLTVDEVHRMYEAIRGQTVAWAQAELVHRQTEGHPLFVQEVLRYLVEEGLVVREGGRYQVRPEAQQNEAVLPDGLRDVVGRRLSRLSEKTNQVLSMAAVIGREFRLDVLQSLLGQPKSGAGRHPLPEERVEPVLSKVEGVRGEASSSVAPANDEESLYVALEEAQGRAIIEQRSLPGGLGFRFTHAFFRTTLYEEIFTPRRIRLHQQVGRALEEIYARRPDEHAAELAEHFSQSTEEADLQKSVRYSELAAQRAMAVYAYGEAVRHLEQALRAQEVLDPEDRARRCDLLLALAEALNNGGEPQRVREIVAPEALALAEAVADSERCIRICKIAIDAIHASTANRGWDTLQVVGWAEAADRHAKEGTVGRVWADGALGRVRVIAGQTDEGRALLAHAIELARGLNDNAAFWFAAMIWMETMLTQSATVSRKEGLAISEELLARSREGVSPLVLRTALFFTMGSFLAAGRRPELEALSAEMQALADRTRQPQP